MTRHRLRERLLVVAVGALGLAAAGGCQCGAPAVVGGDDTPLVRVDSGVPDAGFPQDAGPAALTCSSCHGGDENAAPPRDTDGGTALSLRTVGAHQAHLRPGRWHRAVQCDDCHVVPQHVEDPGHIDPPPAELTWSTVASASGVTPTFNGDDTCTNWCHGAGLTGGNLTAPVWTRFDIDQAYCGDCHGVPPPPPHVQNVGADCSPCHDDAAPGLSWKDPSRHIDGVVDVNVTCTSCHGSDGNPAPPKDTLGEVATTARGVGAHRQHLAASGWHRDVQCTDCHQVPQALDDPGHIDTPLPAELTWGPVARARGAQPDFNGVSCSVYCHGSTLDGGTNTEPVWTEVDGTQATCGSCHGLPPPPPHPQNPACSMCHGAVIAADGGWVDKNLHIDGMVEAQATCGSCHALPPPTGAHLAHATGAPAVYGDLTTAASQTNPSGYVFGCGFCHPTDPARHMNGGLAEVELYDPTAGGLKALNPPTASYTPGSTQLTDGFGMPYTLGTCSNVYCHSGPSYATPNGVPDPVPGVDGGFPYTYPAFTLVKDRTYATIGFGDAPRVCGDCHGLPIRTSEPTVQAMAGQSHSFIDGQGYESGHAFNHGLAAPLSCRTCHYATVEALNPTEVDGGIASYGPVPIVGFGRHVNGRPDVVFDTVDTIQYRTQKSLAGASYDQATATCSNVSCHLAQTAVQHGTPYRWENWTECDACHRY